MKKIFSVGLMAVIMLMTGCSSKTPTVTNDFDYKVGTASYTHTNDSYGYTEGRNGRGAVSTTLVAAVFDNNGQIVRISIDEVETNVSFDNMGQLADFTPGEVKSKKELGDTYGMKAASSIGKEWYQQIESLEKWLEGKKVHTVIGGATAKLGEMIDSDSATGYTDQHGNYTPDSNSTVTTNSNLTVASDNSPVSNVISGVTSMIDDMTDGGENFSDSTANTGWTDEDLKASVTINTTYIQKAVEKAYRNAK